VAVVVPDVGDAARIRDRVEAVRAGGQVISTPLMVTVNGAVAVQMFAAKSRCV